MVFEPANAGVNVTVAITVMLPPTMVTTTLEAGMLHWLFESVSLLPGVTRPPIAVPESSTRSSVLLCVS